MFPNRSGLSTANRVSAAQAPSSAWSRASTTARSNWLRHCVLKGRIGYLSVGWAFLPVLSLSGRNAQPTHGPFVGQECPTYSWSFRRAGMRNLQCPSCEAPNRRNSSRPVASGGGSSGTSGLAGARPSPDCARCTARHGTDAPRPARSGRSFPVARWSRNRRPPG
jgi:hypothetical protein